MMGWFGNFWDSFTGRLKAFFAGPGGRIIRDAVAAAIEQLGPLAFAVLLDAAKTQVLALEQDSGLSGAAKKDAATAYLLGYANKAGVSVGASLANYIVESAVQSIKAPAL